MVDVSVGVASACIAAVITILQFLLPNALALVMTGHVSESQSAVTWSVVSRFLLTSDWPTFLRSDHTASTGVTRKISLLTWAKPLGLLLIAVSAIVTPLGLYERIGPSSSSRVISFAYVNDQSVFGAGTPPRSSRGYKFSRLCYNYDGNALCPGDPYNGNTTILYTSNSSSNGTEEHTTYVIPESISSSLIDLYQGGLSSLAPSVSSFFDIQFRQWTTVADSRVKNNGTLLARSSKFLSSIVMDNKWELFEGTITDTRSGGIGFRNHSVPTAFYVYGSEWEEDILWMQPEASCVNSNLSSILTGSVSDITLNITDLVDEGGFTNIAKTSPVPANLSVLWNGQNHPMLYERAYWMAWYLNYHAMQYLNITDPGTNRSRISSSIGQHFSKIQSDLTDVSSFKKTEMFNIQTGYRFNELIVAAPSSYSWNRTTGTWGKYLKNPNIPNPYNITNDPISDANLLLKSYGGGDLLNISTIAIQLGYIIGPATMLDQTDPSNATSVATYRRPLYICSAATKASIKTVRFRYNSTTINNLRNLEVIDIKDKVYSKEEDKPIWGFEMPWVNSTTQWNISNINALWGIVDESVLNNRNVSTLRSDHFYIPASASASLAIGYSSSIYNDFMAGTTGPSANWAEAFGYRPGALEDDVKITFFKEMTRNSTNAERLAQLMWTDSANNYMVGTRGLHNPRYKPFGNQKRAYPIPSAASDSLPATDTTNLHSGQFPVYTLERQLGYKMAYGIPAAICCLFVGFSVVWAVLGIIFGNASIARLRHLMYNISAGRVYAAYVYPELQGEKTAHTKQWIQNVGHRPVQAYGLSSSAVSMELELIQRQGGGVGTGGGNGMDHGMAMGVDTRYERDIGDIRDVKGPYERIAQRDDSYTTKY